MSRVASVVAGVAGSVLAASGAWTLYQRYTTDEVPYTVVDHVGDVELRQYPAQVLVETVAPSENAAFSRLFHYIDGANAGREDITMTTPVAVGETGTAIEMTAPVEVGGRTVPMATPDATSPRGGEEGVRMAFFLPSEYDVDSAPDPFDDAVDVASVPERTLAASRFTWWPTDRRVARKTEALLETLESAGVPVVGEPVFLGYDAPWTLPFLRRNEVAVEVESNGHS